MAGVNFTISGDSTELRRALAQAQAAVRNATQMIEGSGESVETFFNKTTKSVKEETSEINGAVGRIKNAFLSLGAAWSSQELARKIIQVRGEFQQLEVAMKTMLGGSQEAASKLMGEMTTLAATTPFGLQEVAGGAKQLLAYGMEANKLTDTLTRLGNIASGLSIPLNDLIYLYGTTMAQGRMMTQDVNQFAGRGIPIIAELAKQLGVAESEVKDLVSQGRVGFEHLEGVIASLTNQGGMFFNLMQEQSKTIPGQISNLEDSIDMMLNDLGKATEGMISDAISLLNTLVENYRTVGDAILTLVATYGTYRTALMLNIAMEKVAALSRLAQIKGMQTHALVAQILSGKLKALYAAMTAHPYALAAAAVVALVGAMVTMANATSAAEKEADRMKKRTEEQAKETDELKNKTQELRDAIVDETKTEEERQEALNKLKSLWPDVFSDYKTYIEYSNNAAEALRRETEALRNRNREQQRTNYKEDVSLLEAIQNFIKVDNRLRKQDENKGINKNAYIKTDEYKIALTQLKGAYHDLTGEYAGLGDGGYFATKWANEILPEIRKSVNKQSEEIRQGINAEFEAGVSKMSEEALTSTIGKYQEWVKKANNEGKKWIDMGDVPIAVSTIQSRIEQMQTRLDTINKDANRDFLKDAKTAYDKAKKESDKIRKNQHGYKTETEWAKALKEAEDKEKTAKKKYEEYLGESAKSIQSAQEKKAQTLKKANDLLLSIQQDNSEQEVKLMKEGNDKIVAQIDNDWEKRNKEIVKKAKELSELNKKTGVNTESSVHVNGTTIGGLTEEQAKAIDTAIINSAKLRQEETNKARREEIASMREYIAQYGSIEQKRLSIAEDYDDKISKAKTKGERLLFEKEKQNALTKLSVEEIAKGINWNVLFNGIASLSTEMLEPTMEKLQAFTNTEEYRLADADTKEQVNAFITQIRQLLGSDISSTWESLAIGINKFVESVGIYNQAVEDEKLAIEALNKAEGEYKKGNITEDEYNTLKEKAHELGKATVEAEQSMESLGSHVNTLTDKIANYTSKLSAEINKAKGWIGLEGFDDIQGSLQDIDRYKGNLDIALSQMNGGTGEVIASNISSTLGKGLDSIGTSMSSILSSGVTQMVGFIAQLPRLILNIASSVKNFVTGVLDSLTEFVSLRWIDDLINGILDSIGNLIDAIFDLPENLYKTLESIIVDGVGGLINTILGRVLNVLSFGALDHEGPASWFKGSNASEVTKTIEKLTQKNEILTDAIDRLRETMVSAEGGKSVDSYNQAIEYQKEQEANLKEIAQAQASYHNAHQSFNKYWGGFTDEQIQRLSEQIGREWSGSLWDLSADEMSALLGNVDMVEAIINTGKGGYGERVYEKLKDYAGEAGKLEELTRELRESLTSISFDSMYDSFVSSLLDMEASAEDIADNVSEYFMKAMLSNFVGEEMKDDLKKWYEEYGALMEQYYNGEITEDELLKEQERLKGEYQGIVNEGVEKRNQLAEATGYGDIAQKEGSSTRSVASMSQETAEELNGRFTALQMSNESINTSMLSAVQSLSDINVLLVSSQGELSEIKSLAVSRNGLLEEMIKYTKHMLGFGDILKRIETNTSTL